MKQTTRKRTRLPLFTITLVTIPVVLSRARHSSRPPLNVGDLPLSEYEPGSARNWNFPLAAWPTAVVFPRELVSFIVPES